MATARFASTQFRAKSPQFSAFLLSLLLLRHNVLLLQITEEEFIVGFNNVYCAACPKVDWAGELPEGAFSEYESRGAVIPEGEYRATTLGQLRSLAMLIKQVIGGVIGEDSVYKPQRGAALDAIVANNLEDFKLAMLTIHSSEGIWETDKEGDEARKSAGLPNSVDSYADKASSLAR